jgi:hypothetical protein
MIIVQTVLLWVIAICLCEIGIELKKIRKQNEREDNKH